MKTHRRLRIDLLRFLVVRLVGIVKFEAGFEVVFEGSNRAASIHQRRIRDGVLRNHLTSVGSDETSPHPSTIDGGRESDPRSPGRVAREAVPVDPIGRIPVRHSIQRRPSPIGGLFRVTNAEEKIHATRDHHCDWLHYGSHRPPRVENGPDAASWSGLCACWGNMRNFGEALLQYQAKHGGFRHLIFQTTKAVRLIAGGSRSCHRSKSATQKSFPSTDSTNLGTAHIMRLFVTRAFGGTITVQVIQEHAARPATSWWSVAIRLFLVRMAFA